MHHRARTREPSGPGGRPPWTGCSGGSRRRPLRVWLPSPFAGKVASMTTPAAEAIDVNGPEPDLKRVMGPKLLLLFIVGDILGAGVYAVTGADGRRSSAASCGCRSSWPSRSPP